MSEKWSRIKYQILNKTSKLLRYYKNYLLVFFILFLISFITGLLTASKYTDDLTCENLINTHLYSFLINDINFISLFLILSILLLLFCLFVILLTRNKFFIILNYLFFMLFSYIFGFDLCVIITCLGLAGIILGIAIWGVFNLFIFIMIMLILSIACKRVKEKNCSAQTFNNGTYRKIYFLLILIILILIFLMCILFSLIHIFVIVE